MREFIDKSLVAKFFIRILKMFGFFVALFVVTNTAFTIYKAITGKELNDQIADLIINSELYVLWIYFNVKLIKRILVSKNIIARIIYVLIAIIVTGISITFVAMFISEIRYIWFNIEALNAQACLNSRMYSFGCLKGWENSLY